MSTDELIAHVDDSIARALRGESWLDPAVLDIKGFSTATQRHLVSNLAHNHCYLEAGLHTGSSFCAAANNNRGGLCVGIEDWSQDFSYEDVKQQFQSNLEATQNKAQIIIAERDCFGELPHCFPMDVFYFDAEHSFESHAKALPHFIDCMAATFIYMVDDFAWIPVMKGTCFGFDDLKDRIVIEKEWVLDEGEPDSVLWHNGVAVFCIRKL